MSRRQGAATAPSGARVTVRMAGQRDAVALARLAALDSASAPPGPTLVAEVDGEAVAALPVEGGSAVADPFRRTRALVELLELRAAQLRGEGRGTPAGSYVERLRGLLRRARTLPLR